MRILKQRPGALEWSECGLSSFSNRIGGGRVALAPAQDDTTHTSLEFSVYVDLDAPRPPYWETLKRRLKAMGFELEGGFGEDDDEVFVPRTFFSADVGIEATRQYAAGQEREMAHDLQVIADYLSTQNTSRSAGQRKHEYQGQGQG